MECFMAILHPDAGVVYGGRRLCRTDRVCAAGEPLMLSGSDCLTCWATPPAASDRDRRAIKLREDSVLSGGERGNKSGKKHDGPGAWTALLKRATRLK